MEKFFPIEKIAMRVLSPVSKRLFHLELPNQRAMSDIEKIYAQLIQLEELLRNREVTSIRLVSVPEKMVVEETKRNYMYMNLYNFQVDGLYINRILPQDMENAFFEEWMEIQGGYIKELQEVFGGIPIYKIPWFDSELTGIAGIERIEQEVLTGQEIFAIHADIEGERYEQTDEGYEMKLPLPFIQKEDIKLHESDQEVIVRIGNFKRNIPKPSVLREYELGGGKLEAGMLTIRFLKRR
jgi:arsenite-transporting ATPase